MDNLGTSYHDTVYVIPYRNLTIMMKDKLHAVYGEKLEEVTEDEFFMLKGKANPLKK